MQESPIITFFVFDEAFVSSDMQFLERLTSSESEIEESLSESIENLDFEVLFWSLLRYKFEFSKVLFNSIFFKLPDNLLEEGKTASSSLLLRLPANIECLFPTFGDIFLADFFALSNKSLLDISDNFLLLSTFWLRSTWLGEKAGLQELNGEKEDIIWLTSCFLLWGVEHLEDRDDGDDEE